MDSWASLDSSELELLDHTFLIISSGDHLHTNIWEPMTWAHVQGRQEWPTLPHSDLSAGTQPAAQSDLQVKGKQAAAHVPRWKLNSIFIELA